MFVLLRCLQVININITFLTSLVIFVCDQLILKLIISPALCSVYVYAQNYPSDNILCKVK